MHLCIYPFQGRHIVEDNFTVCPQCDFPAIRSEFLRLVIICFPFLPPSYPPPLPPESNKSFNYKIMHLFILIESLNRTRHVRCVQNA